VSALHDLAESKIRDAIAAGVFDDLPGRGEPLRLEERSGVPAELRAAYTVLRNAGCLPEEMELRRGLVRLRDLLDACTDGDQRARLEARRRDLALRYELCMERHGTRVERAGYRGVLLRGRGR
jgi:hypothetical protein